MLQVARKLVQVVLLFQLVYGSRHRHPKVCSNKTEISLGLTTPSVHILSPNFPADYPADAEVCWVVTVPPDDRRELGDITNIKLTVNFIDVEYENETQLMRSNSRPDKLDCDKDKIVIHGGSSPKYCTLDCICGTRIPLPIVSGHKGMYIVFTSNDEEERKGFNMSLSLTNDKPIPCKGKRKVMLALLLVIASIGFISVVSIAVYGFMKSRANNKLTSGAKVPVFRQPSTTEGEESVTVAYTIPGKADEPFTKTETETESRAIESNSAVPSKTELSDKEVDTLPMDLEVLPLEVGGAPSAQSEADA